MPAARCYSGSRDQVEIDQMREYISVNRKACFEERCADPVNEQSPRQEPLVALHEKRPWRVTPGDPVVEDGRDWA